MPIKQTTPKGQIDKQIDEYAERINVAAIRVLMYVGEVCLTKARKTKSYKDQTGNLRSSIGYIVIDNGRVVNMSAFEAVKQGHHGTKEGAKYALEVAKNYPTGVVLVLVAGMNYAEYVARRYDVIDGAELTASRVTPKLLKKLGLGI